MSALQEKCMDGMLLLAWVIAMVSMHEAYGAGESITIVAFTLSSVGLGLISVLAQRHYSHDWFRLGVDGTLLAFIVSLMSMIYYSLERTYPFTWDRLIIISIGGLVGSILGVSALKFLKQMPIT